MHVLKYRTEPAQHVRHLFEYVTHYTTVQCEMCTCTYNTLFRKLCLNTELVFLCEDVLSTHPHTHTHTCTHTHTHTHMFTPTHTHTCHRNVMLLAVEEWSHTHQTRMMKSSMTMATTTAQRTQVTTFVNTTRNVTDVPSVTVGNGSCEQRKVVELNQGW